MDNNAVQEIDIVDVPDTEVSPANPQQTLFSLQEFTVETSGSIDQLKKTLRVAGEMVNERLKNNPEFAQIQEKVKEVQKDKLTVKNNILSASDMQALTSKMKTVRQEIKEKKSSLSDYALEYKRMSGATEIVKDGTVYDIVEVAKLVKRVS